MIDLQMIGQMDNTLDHTHESANRVYSPEGVAPTLNTCGGGGLQPKILDATLLGGLGERVSNGGTQYYQQDRVYDSNGVAMAHPAQIPEGSYKYMVENNKHTYRIRKLTPKECFRLMGVRDEDYEKLTVSNTQKYKQAGNSIVVDVMMDIFTNLFVKECKSNRLF